MTASLAAAVAVAVPIEAELTRAAVEAIIGPIAMWNDEPNAVSFRPNHVITLLQLNELGKTFGLGLERVEVFTGKVDDDMHEAGEVTILRHATPARRAESGVFKIGCT